MEAFRRLDLAASALGNHEFDWTVDTLRARIRQAPYAILGANVRFTDGRAVPWLRADTIVRRGGLRVGVVGLATTETPTTTRAANVRGLRFDSLAPVIDAHARALRARGADVVIVVAHSGAFCDRPAPGESTPTCRGEIVDVARALHEKVDAIVSGHTHSLVNTVVNGIPIVQARSSGRALGVVDLSLEGGAPTIDVREVVADSAGPVPPAIDSVVRRAVAAVASRVNRRIADVADDMPRESDEQYALGNLLADAQRWAGRGDVAIMNNGGIRADLRHGVATYGSLFEIQPFGNTLYKITVRGRDLRGYFEKLVSGGPRVRMHTSGVLVTFDPSRPAGSRLVSLTTADGRPLDDDRLYTMVLNDFLVTGGDGVDLARRATAVTPLNIVDLDALVGYLGTLPQPVRAPSEERFRVAGASQ
ncbi:5'-Nucleotidase domain-containing protein [Gemmatirosa kalamazoonensis]|uniref:5'-Nucleotidase domain-containing protein n=1 Tax=Gemmatirosa kalamazoonensis TaxID=861299 RepID=W0RM37_9BACT|nr:5'-Nucleotidase domain-containing protein [Gemmatirosa kalamazoonensis]